MDKLTLDYGYLHPLVSQQAVRGWQMRVDLAHRMLHEKCGPGREYLGWLDVAQLAPPGLVEQINTISAELRASSDVIVIVGIGGSYLGARAVIEALGGSRPGCPQILFAGQNLSASYHQKLLADLQGKRVSVNVISKSGTTTEPAIAFRLLREFLYKTYSPEEARRRIVATTDATRGALRELAGLEGYRLFTIPDDVGGRYSVLTPVGLLPIACAGFSISTLLQGAGAMAQRAAETDACQNPAYFYAVARNMLYLQGKTVEVLSTFEPCLQTLGEWWKQLFGESEGKNHTGLFPASTVFTTDLHSLGQYLQEGRRHLLETFLIITPSTGGLTIPSETTNRDELNYLAGKPLSEINTQAYLGTSLAHYQGGVPNMTILLPRLDEYFVGQILYFFEKACGLSGHLLGVNPFDQPGVESYKRNMFALLGKEGTAKEKEKVEREIALRQGKFLI